MMFSGSFSVEHPALSSSNCSHCPEGLLAASSGQRVNSPRHLKEEQQTYEGVEVGWERLRNQEPVTVL